MTDHRDRPPLTLDDIAEGLKRFVEIGDQDHWRRKVAADGAAAYSRNHTMKDTDDNG